MAASAQKSVSSTNVDVNAVTAQILAALDTKAAVNAHTFTERVADRISETGNGFAEVAAGLSAAVDNYAITKQSALLRQKKRTAEKARLLAERIVALS